MRRARSWTEVRTLWYPATASMRAEFRYQPGELVPGTGLKVLRGIGSGGMGSVYEVEETSVEAPFVMKVVHAHLLASGGSRIADRMRQEAKTLARLNHKNIVRVYRAGVTDESPPLPFYVMDRLSGYTVQHLLRWHSARQLLLPLNWVFWIVSSLLSALDHAHEHGIVHRDVKPENIFVHQGEKPVVKLLDFGVMALCELAGDRLTADGGFAGTYTHAAPEQLRGDPPAPAMDIYAAGMVLFELLMGVGPFASCESPGAIVQAHMNASPPPLSGGRRQVHPKLEELVLRMLAKEPANRPPSARAVLHELARIKTMWVQQAADSFVGQTEFEFEVEERWPTNFDAGDDPSVDKDAGGAPSEWGPWSAALLNAPELARVKPVALSSAPGSGEDSTRRDRPRSAAESGRRLSSRTILLAVAGLAGAGGAVGAGWRLTSRSPPEASAVPASQPSGAVQIASPVANREALSTLSGSAPTPAAEDRASDSGISTAPVASTQVVHSRAEPRSVGASKSTPATPSVPKRAAHVEPSVQAPVQSDPVDPMQP